MAGPKEIAILVRSEIETVARHRADEAYRGNVKHLERLV